MVTPIETTFSLTGFFDSRQGGRSENQDYALAAETPSGVLVVVCDGMGGMQGGSTASRIAATDIIDQICKGDTQENNAMMLTKAIRHANNAVWTAGNENPELHGMGTTVTALLVDNRCATVAHVGDSRIYQLRKGKKIFRTFDHSMVFEMVRKKVITEEQARLSVQSNIILRALGIKPDVEVETAVLNYRKGDRFVLCTDGFWGMFPEKDLLSLLAAENTPDKILESTCNAVDSAGRAKGGEYDNLTAAIVDIDKTSDIKPRLLNSSQIAAITTGAVILASIITLWLIS